MLGPVKLQILDQTTVFEKPSAIIFHGKVLREIQHGAEMFELRGCGVAQRPVTEDRILEHMDFLEHAHTPFC